MSPHPVYGADRRVKGPNSMLWEKAKLDWPVSDQVRNKRNKPLPRYQGMPRQQQAVFSLPLTPLSTPRKKASCSLQLLPSLCSASHTPRKTNCSIALFTHISPMKNSPRSTNCGRDKNVLSHVTHLEIVATQAGPASPTAVAVYKARFPAALAQVVVHREPVPQSAASKRAMSPMS